MLRKKTLALILPLSILITGCSAGSENVEDSTRYIKAPIQDVVNEWMTARNGTIKASGNESFYYDEAETSSVDTSSTDIRYDLPGQHCFLTDNDTETASIFFDVSTKTVEASNVDLEAESEKVADFWRSQGWNDIQRGAEAQDQRRIFVTTPLGTQVTFTVTNWDGYLMKTLQMESLCAKEFGKGSPAYFGDFNDRYNQTSTAVSEENR